MQVLTLLTVSLAALCASSARHMSARHHLADFRGHQHHISYDPDNNWIAAVTEHNYTEAILDHFAPVSAVKHWNQRYFVNDEFWAGEGYPVFLYIGGEGPLSASALSKNNYIHTLARSHRALLVAVEHRYYGKSGSLSAGATPAHLRPGSVASSAPLWAKEDFPEYMEVVGNGLRYFGGGECYRAVEQAMVALHALLDGGREGRQKLAELFSPCSPMKNEFDDSVFESSVMSLFQGVAQYNDIYGGLTLTDVCNIFSRGNDSLAQLVDFVNQAKTKPCLDSNFQGTPNGTVEVLSETAFDGKSSSRQWFYQTCNEFGYFQTATTKQSPFWPLKTQTLQNVGLEVCKRVFGIAAHPDTLGTNIYYGSLDITVDHVVFPSGTVDPWHFLAVQNTTHMNMATARPIFIEGTAHCADMHAPNATKDSGHMVWARQQIASAVAAFVHSAVAAE
uniref:Secreted protein n=1 Tax=Achlya hypogyna TaxID=1202772 RepID=A0A0A7CNA6_ACHHY|nr:secreted protein [Achlya hypogyna]